MSSRPSGSPIEATAPRGLGIGLSNPSISSTHGGAVDARSDGIAKGHPSTSPSISPLVSTRSAWSRCRRPWPGNKAGAAFGPRRVERSVVDDEGDVRDLLRVVSIVGMQVHEAGSALKGWPSGNDARRRHHFRRGHAGGRTLFLHPQRADTGCHDTASTRPSRSRRSRAATIEGAPSSKVHVHMAKPWNRRSCSLRWRISVSTSSRTDLEAGQLRPGRVRVTGFNRERPSHDPESMTRRGPRADSRRSCPGILPALWPLFRQAPAREGAHPRSYSALVQLRPFLRRGGPYRVVHVGDGAHARTRRCCPEDDRGEHQRRSSGDVRLLEPGRSVRGHGACLAKGTHPGRHRRSERTAKMPTRW